jgi:hypothetical protein
MWRLEYPGRSMTNFWPAGETGSHKAQMSQAATTMIAISVMESSFRTLRNSLEEG